MAVGEELTIFWLLTKIRPFLVTVSESGEACTLAFAEHCLIGSRQPDSADVLNVPNTWAFFKAVWAFKKSLWRNRVCLFYCFVGFFVWFGLLFFFFKQVNTGTAESVTAEESNPKKHAFICSSLKRERKKSWLWPCFQKRWGTNYLKWRKNKCRFFDVAVNSLLPEASWKFLISSTGFWTRALGCLRELNTTRGQGAPTQLIELLC